MLQVLLLLTLSAIGGQCQEYFYNKPSTPFYQEDSSQHHQYQQQHLTPFGSMTIPGAHGGNYEVSMAPARNIFEMHLGRHQYYTQGQVHNVPYNQQQQQQQQSNAHFQQSASHKVAAATATLKTPNFPSVAATFNGPPQSSLPLSHVSRRPKPSSRILRVCYTSGRCEYVNDNQELQRILQQSRTNYSPGSKLGEHQHALSAATKRGLHDRRLFPYSEVVIARYPYDQ